MASPLYAAQLAAIMPEERYSLAKNQKQESKSEGYNHVLMAATSAEMAASSGKRSKANTQSAPMKASVWG